MQENMSSSASPVNISEEERSAYLSSLQDTTTAMMLPSMIMLIIIACIGTVGNSLVLIVYSGRSRQTSTRIFIMSIAGFDLVTNVLVIPGEVYNMFHKWEFNQPNFCRARLFCSCFTTISAALILLGVAVVRFRKVCRPFGWQVTIRNAKIICASIVLFSFLSATPCGVINGRQTKATPRAGVVGHMCTVDDSYKDTIWPLVVVSFFMLLFLFSCTPLVVIYAMIGRRAWKHGRLCRRRSSSVSSSVSRKTNVSTDSGGKREAHKTVESDERSDLKTCDSMAQEDAAFEGVELAENPGSTKSQTCSNAENPPNEHTSCLARSTSSSSKGATNADDEIKDGGTSVPLNNTSVSAKKSAKKPITGFRRSIQTSVSQAFSKLRRASTVSAQNRGVGRTTMMLLIITIVYILSLLPFLVCLLIPSLNRKVYKAMNFGELSVYNFFRRIYFLNSVANPIVYSLLDSRFREQCRALFKWRN